ncbi:MAG: class 1 fructose-bisphosphatase, partial [Planctomycetota bacterium]
MLKGTVVTIQRHIVEQERMFPKATGDFTGLLWDLTLAAKTISREVNKAGIVDIIGLTGESNVHGEAVKKLDVFANERICKAMEHGGHLSVMAS